MATPSIRIPSISSIFGLTDRHSFDGRLTISAARKEVKGIKEVDNSFDRLDLALICYYVYILSDQEGFKARLDRCSE
jgi:hypothetical protein